MRGAAKMWIVGHQTPQSFYIGGFANTSEHRKQVHDASREELKLGLGLDIPNLVHVFGCVQRLDRLVEAICFPCEKGHTPLYTEGCGSIKWRWGMMSPRMMMISAK